MTSCNKQVSSAHDRSNFRRKYGKYTQDRPSEAIKIKDPLIPNQPTSSNMTLLMWMVWERDRRLKYFLAPVFLVHFFTAAVISQIYLHRMTRMSLTLSLLLPIIVLDLVSPIPGSELYGSVFTIPSAVLSACFVLLMLSRII